jgi:hypothetical protein
MKVEYKQSFQEWEKEHVARVAWLREKYRLLLTTPKLVRKVKKVSL